MDRPLISIIIPAFNSKKFIDETIASVLNQSYSNFEVIVVDDGSTDGQRDCLFRWCNSDARIRCIYKSNQGVSVARNTGFNHSIGAYIAFLDADDVWMPDNLSVKLLKFKSGDFGLVHSDGYLMDENSNSKEGIMFGREGKLLKNMLKWDGTQVPGPSSILVRREVIHKIGLFDTNLSTSADHDFFLRVASKFNIGRVPSPTWKYRLHSENMHRNIQLMERDVLCVYKKASDNNLFNDFWFKRECYAIMYLILAASWAGDGGNKIRAFYFTCLGILNHPSAILNIFKRVVKRWL